MQPYTNFHFIFQMFLRLPPAIHLRCSTGAWWRRLRRRTTSWGRWESRSFKNLNLFKQYSELLSFVLYILPLHCHDKITFFIKFLILLKVECDRGYVIMGKSRIKCRRGIWSAKTPVCTSEYLLLACKDAFFPNLHSHYFPATSVWMDNKEVLHHCANLFARNVDP